MSFFFFNDTATTEIYTLSLHDALPISRSCSSSCLTSMSGGGSDVESRSADSRSRSDESSSRLAASRSRSEEHTSELQSPNHLVSPLLLQKKKKIFNLHTAPLPVAVDIF